MQNKRLINFRPIFFLFIVLITSIFTFVKINLSLYYLFLLIIPILFFVILIFKKKFVFLCFSIFLVCLSSLTSYFYVANYSNNNFDGAFAVVNADIARINKINQNFYYLTLSNCKITTQDETNFALEGKLSLQFSIYADNVEFNEGDKIVFASTINTESFFNEYNEINSFNIKEDIKYSSKISYSNDVKFYNQEKGSLQNFKDYNQTLLINNFGEDYGNLAFALLFGDRQDANKDILDVFKYSGVMHIFSVSGLHVGLIVALLYFLLSKLPINKYVKFAISFIFLAIYCMLCSFSAPVVRASIMALVVMFAKLFFRKPDIINSFSVAGIILLLINPMNLYDGGFQMSFVAVFGLIFFLTIFNKIKIKNVILKKFVMFVATSISTQIAMLPVLAKFYGYVATYSLISNLLTLPLFSIFYPILFVVNLIVLIFPFMAFLYFVPKAMLVVLIYINQLIVTLPNGIIKIKRFGLFSTILYFVTIFCASKYLMIKPIQKIVLCLSLLVISLTSWYVFSLPKINNQNAIVLCSSELSSATLLTTQDNKYYLVNPNVSKSTYELEQWLINQKIDKIESVLITNTDIYEAKKLYLFMKQLSCNTVYLPQNHASAVNLKQMGVNVYTIENSCKINDFDINFYYFESKIVASVISHKNYVYSTLDCNNLVQSEISSMISNYFTLDINVVKIYNNKNNHQVNIQKAQEIIYELNSNLTFSYN